MPVLTDAMERLAVLLAGATDRTVTTDPRNLAPPCVLVEPPEVESTGTLCGSWHLRHVVRVIGMPGARAELEPLAVLLEEVLNRLDGTDDAPGWTDATFEPFTPLSASATQEPSMCYRVLAEEMTT